MTTSARRARQLRRAEQAFRILGRHGGVFKAAAAELEIAESTLRKRIADYCRIHGYLTPFDAAYHARPEEKQTANRT